MSDQLSAAAQAMGIPEALVERSARAKADATGQTYEDVLAAWAGGEAAGSAPPEAPAPETAPPVEDEQTEDPQEIAPRPEAEVPATPPSDAAAAGLEPIGPPPTPERVSPEEALEYPVVVTVPTAAITERTGFSIPTWLSALLLIIPAFGLIYLSGAAGAECGDATRLRVDRVTGLVENCDGTPFEGRGAPGGSTDPIAVGAEVFASCVACHGAEGQGVGAFPSLTGVLSTFGSCDDHLEWVALGSTGFTTAGRDTYGDTNQQVDPGMPGFGGSLTDNQLAAVVAFERVRLAGGNQDEVLADCGLAEEADAEADGETDADTDGEEPADGEAPADDEEPATEEAG